jgi:hypothetical protein
LDLIAQEVWFEEEWERSHAPGKRDFQHMASLIALMMEAVQTYETSVNSYHSTRRYNPKDSHLHDLNLKIV